MSARHATPLRLDPSACDGCLRCSTVCDRRALKIGPGYIFVDWERCDACGACAKACTTGAIERRGTAAAADGPPVVPKPLTEAPAAAVAHANDAKANGARKPARATVLGLEAGWGLAEAALVVVTAFALLVLVQVFGPLAGNAGSTLLAYDAALAALLVFLAVRRRAGSFARFRLDRRPEVSSALLAVGLGVGCWAFAIAYRVSAMGLGFRPPASDSVNLASLFGPGIAGAAATIVVVGLIGPVVEEAALRGVLAGALKSRFGRAVAVIVPAVVFALLHASLWSFVPLTVLGLALGWLSVRSRSLWPAIVAHVLYNAVLVVAALYAVSRA